MASLQQGYLQRVDIFQLQICLLSFLAVLHAQVVCGRACGLEGSLHSPGLADHLC